MPPPPMVNDDPEEVDISQHFYTPERRRPEAAGEGAGGMGGGMGGMGGMGGAGMGGMGGGMGMGLDEAQLRTLMLGGPAPGANPFAPAGPPGAGADEDPMMRMMSQMLGAGAGGPGGASPFPFPPGFPGQSATTMVPNKSTSIWRLLHTALALGLGLYIALWTTFRGTKGERTLGLVEEGEETARKRFFYAFATAEAVLLTTRYFVEGTGGGGAGGGGVLGMVVGFLPPGPAKEWVEMGMRYARVLGTVRGDVLVCVFVLGVCSWVRG